MGGSAVKTKEKDKRGSSQWVPRLRRLGVRWELRYFAGRLRRPSKSDSSTTKPIALVSYSGMKAQSLKKLLEVRTASSLSFFHLTLRPLLSGAKSPDDSPLHSNNCL
jgi:hypothetical protein